MRSAWILSILAKRISGMWRVPQPGRHVHRNDYTKSKTFKTENGARRWLERNQVSDMDFDTIMEKAYEEYFEALPKAKKLSASVSLNRRFPLGKI